MKDAKIPRKICSNPECKKAGIPQILNQNFYENNKMTDGFLNKCISCVNRDVMARNKLKEPRKDYKVDLPLWGVPHA